MAGIDFSKFHGFGNDYIVIERRNIPAGSSIEQLAREICARHTGAGADGIAVLDRLDGAVADLHCEIINPDGSFASFSGNGTRCAVAYLYRKGLWTEGKLRLRTRSGVKNFRLLSQPDERSYEFAAEIGKPSLASDKIPFTSPVIREAVVNETLTLGGKTERIGAVNIGNPVACLFVDEFPNDWRRIASELEANERFPRRVNAVIVRVIDRTNIEVRIWERGAGETAASGTCASGAAVLSALMLKTDRTVNVHSPGGVTLVEWRNDDEVVLTGTCWFIYDGVWPV